MDTPLNRADPTALRDLVATDPESARRQAIAAARLAAPPERIELLSIAGEASVRLGAVADGRTLFEAAADLARRQQHPSLAGLLVRRAAMEAATGAGDQALATLDEAEPLLGAEAWRAWYQRGLILHWAGRSEEALDALDRARPAAERSGDSATSLKLLLNRAIARAHLGDLSGAAADAAHAEQRCRALGEPALAAQALHNRGWIAARSGDLADGWRLMRDAAADPSWVAPPVVLADRAEVAHLAGLLAEAADLADAAWNALRAAGDEHGAATTSLLRAQIALDLGDPNAALELTDEVDGWLAAQGRSDLLGASAAVRLAAHRDLCEHRTAVDLAERLARARRALSDSVEAISRHAWSSARTDGLLAAGEIELRAGNDASALTMFDRVVADRHPMAPTTVEQHVAAALAHRVRTGRLDEARLDAAWAELELVRRAPVPHELRGDWGATTRLLTRIVLPPLLGAGDGEGAIRWLERLRSLPAPGGQTDLGSTADDLRAVWSRRRAHRNRSSSGGGLELRDETDDDTDEAAFDDEDEALLEAELVTRARSLARSLVESDPAPAVPSAAELAAAAGDTELIWIVVLTSGAWAIRCSSDRTSVVELDEHLLRAESHQLASSMRLGSSSWRSEAERLDHVLGGRSGSPLGDLGEQVVLVPIGNAVEDLPFAALPSLSERRIRICWSANHWLTTRAAPRYGSVTIASTGVDESAREVELVSSVWPGATAIEGDAVTTDRVLAALATDDLVHVGAHGHLRRDNPMLSTLECANGPLYGYELARAGRVASTVLLWSCALGGARMPGDVGVAGWPAVLARLGCNAVIAAPGALPSGPAPDLAAEVHRGLARGEPTDVVLAELRRLAVGELAARAAAMLAVHGAG